MVEAFGLDRRIENYKGTRPILLYRWDLDCLLSILELAIRDEKRSKRNRRFGPPPDVGALKSLHERLQQEYDSVYGDE